MNSFKNIFELYDWDTLEEEIYSYTPKDVEAVLEKDTISLEDFKVLISPASKDFIEPMAKRSHEQTKKRFGNTIQMYSPMYLSNECQNICTYCGFSMTNQIPRKTLTEEEILQEIKYIKSLGYDHILLVTGEAHKTVGVAYLQNAIQLIRKYFSNISIEVQPLRQEEYELLITEGLYGVLVYQETYHKATYKTHHPKGRKSNFDYRLDTPDRLGKAGIHKIGLGALFGLEDWRVDSFYTALHLKYLQKTYWRTKYSISFPRLRPHEGEIAPKVAMEDADLVQLICAYRLLDKEVELSISTRESEHFRNHILKLGITSMSAASKTNPGGYTVATESLKQFDISDQRSTHAIEQMIKKQGYEVVWKDWEKSYSKPM